jgi:hypothetical protein
VRPSGFNVTIVCKAESHSWVTKWLGTELMSKVLNLIPFATPQVAWDSCVLAVSVMLWSEQQVFSLTLSVVSIIHWAMRWEGSSALGGRSTAWEERGTYRPSEDSAFTPTAPGGQGGCSSLCVCVCSAHHGLGRTVAEGGRTSIARHSHCPDETPKTDHEGLWRGRAGQGTWVSLCLLSILCDSETALKK